MYCARGRAMMHPSRRIKIGGVVLAFIVVITACIWFATRTETDEEWPTQANWPVTVDEAVRDVLPRIPLYQKLEIAFMNKESLAFFHFGLGLQMRNRYGLWRGNEKLALSACGFRCHPDDVSMKILEAVWQELHQRHWWELIGSATTDPRLVPADLA